jgi:dimeric dUTPase (all-alpha-NTP-PPase superfamily)
MNIQVKTYCSLCEITIESDNTKITEGLSFLNRNTKEYEADTDIVEELLTAAFDISRFNKKSDIEMVKEIFEAFLNTSEQEEFLEEIN